MKKTMLINAIEPEESRIALIEDDVLEEFYIERHSRSQTVGNIYKGSVSNIESSIQAAFVDLGLKKNGFLYVSDIMPKEKSEKGEKTAKSKKAEGSAADKKKSGQKIKSLLRKGQNVIAQITKEGIGEKGPSLTTYISLPGRYLVLMPNAKRNGVSRKITDEKERKRLKKLVEGLDIPDNMGAIIRTAGLNQTKRELNRDLKYLHNLWKVISKKTKSEKSPAVIYLESDLVIRAIRDIFSTDVDEIIVDSEDVYKRAKEFLRQVMPKYEKCVTLYKEPEPLFHKYNLEDKLKEIVVKEVILANGGSLVIEQTEALVTIDVNSKKFKEENDPEETAVKTNLEASCEIGRQLRLRDVGGEIVIDFIDMKEAKHIRLVEKKLAETLKRDRARITVLKMSKFCIVEMTRQRMRSSIRDVIYSSCPHCGATGFVKTVESMGLDIIRSLKSGFNNKDVQAVEISANEEVVSFLQNKKRIEIAKLEYNLKKSVTLNKYNGVDVNKIKIKYFSSNGQPVKL